MQDDDEARPSSQPKGNRVGPGVSKKQSSSVLTGKRDRSVSVDADPLNEPANPSSIIEDESEPKLTRKTQRGSPKEKSKRPSKGKNTSTNPNTRSEMLMDADVSPEKENSPASAQFGSSDPIPATAASANSAMMEIDVDGDSPELAVMGDDHSSWTLISHDLEGPIANTKFEQDSAKTHLPSTDRLLWGIDKPTVHFEGEKAWIAKLLKKGLKSLHSAELKDIEITVETVLKRILKQKSSVESV